MSSQRDAHDLPDDGRLADLIETSFGNGPEQCPPHQQLDIGRRALRRRRVLAGVGAAVAVVAVVGAGVTLTEMSGADVSSDTTNGPAAADTAPSTQTTPAISAAERREQRRAEHREEQKLVSTMFPAALTPDGDVIVKDGWKITRRVPDPEPAKSLGVIVTDGDAIRWMLLTVDGASADDANKGYSRFEDWLASMVELDGGPAPTPLVAVDADGTVSAGPGANLVEVRPSPAIPDYTSTGDRLAEVRRDGRTWFVVVRGQGPTPELIPVDADVLPAPTFDALVTYLTAQTDSGEGVR